MKFNLKSVLQYLLSLAVAAALFSFVYGNRSLSELLGRSEQINWEWIGLSLLFAMLSHFSRAWRWAIALRPLGYQVSIWRAYLAVMVGYLANLVVPRMGEFSRCALLQRKEKVPFTASFGAVIAERVVDLLFLLLVIFLTLLLEFDRVGSFVMEQLGAQSLALKDKLPLLFLLVLTGLLSLGAVYIFRERLGQIPLFRKGFTFLSGLREGVLSVLKMPFRQRMQYLAHSLMIWLLYFLMTYILFPSLVPTAHLGVSAGLVVLMMGSLGMVMPVQAGIGFYHLFVSVGVASFGIARIDAEDFAFLIHSSQVAGIVLVGGLALLSSFFIRPRPEQAVTNSESP